MEATITNIIINEGFSKGTAALSFPELVVKILGLVRTYSIHKSIQTPYTKTRKSSGLTEGLKLKKPEILTKSGFLESW